MADNGFDYDLMVEQAMRSVAAAALAEAAAHGLPGDHHFYVSFRTHEDGVQIPARLKAQYPEEMTIVIQYQFWNLVTHPDGFEIELAFGGKRERLVIPYAAMTGFVDPHAHFGLKFGTDAQKTAAVPTAESTPAPKVAEGGQDTGEKIVSLDNFRKK